MYDEKGNELGATKAYKGWDVSIDPDTGAIYAAASEENPEPIEVPVTVLYSDGTVSDKDGEPTVFAHIAALTGPSLADSTEAAGYGKPFFDADGNIRMFPTGSMPPGATFEQTGLTALPVEIDPATGTLGPLEVTRRREDEVRAWDEDQMATFIDRGDFLIESHFQPPMSMSSLVPGWFDEHFRRMHRYNRLASAGALFPADRRGHIKGGKLSFKLQQADLAVLRRALALLTKVHFAGGALEVYPALLKGETLHAGMTHAEIDAYFERAIREPDDVVLSSSHPHGGNAINADPAKGVVDLDQRVHGTANVLVCDASVMPSCIRVNAQLTTMAMADRVTFKKRVFG